MPRPGTPVVHPAMLAQVQQISRGAMSDTGSLTRGTPDRLRYDPESQTVSAPGGATLYTGPARVTPDMVRGAPAPFGEELVSTHRYSVLLPATVTDVAVDDVWTTTSGTDTYLLGRPLRVIEIAAGTHEGERHLTCLDTLT